MCKHNIVRHKNVRHGKFSQVSQGHDHFLRVFMNTGCNSDLGNFVVNSSSSSSSCYAHVSLRRYYLTRVGRILKLYLRTKVSNIFYKSVDFSAPKNKVIHTQQFCMKTKPSIYLGVFSTIRQLRVTGLQTSPVDTKLID